MGFFKDIPPPFKHQEQGTKFLVNNNCVYDMSDPGTGKTRKCLDAIANKRENGYGKVLVLAPKAILEPAWANDCKKFTPHLTTSVATAKNRAAAFEADADIYITNHDAVKWVYEHQRVLEDFDILVVDEITAFKHQSSQRAKALAKIAPGFKIRWGMSGTPNPNGVTDLWHQMMVLDHGKRLGTSFWKFRQAVCEPRQVGPSPDHIQWVDKEGATDVVADLLEDITIRDKFEDCIDIPEHSIQYINFTLSAKHEEFYTKMLEEAVIELQDDDDISAINAGAVTNKLLQIASGAAYNEATVAKTLATERYELVLSLAEEREQCVIAFNWRHQRDELVKLAKKRKLTYDIVDGTTKGNDLPKIVENFQAGNTKILFAQPQSASHGLTLTAGTTTIWASPTYDAERFQQFNRRIYRAGQTRKTETLLVCAENTLEETVYEKLQGKLDQMDNLLSFLTDTKQEPQK